MVLASTKNMMAKITMIRNFANQTLDGFCFSEFTLFRFVVMSCSSPANQSRGLGLLGRAGCPLFLQVWTCLDDGGCLILYLSRASKVQANW
jgi:hypothetical protein